MADLSKITLPNGSTYDLKDTTARAMTGFYVGTCATAAGTKDKVVTLTDATGFELKAGVVVAVKFTYSNTYSSSTTNPVTLNVNSTGAKNIWYAGVHSGSGNTGANTRIYGFSARYIYYIYDGTYWVWLNEGWEDDTNYHMPTCTTAAGTAAKTAVCSHYTLLANSYIPVVIQNTNTAASALTLNVNSKGARPIYINGAASSSSNHTLPRGTYIVFYDGTNYYFRTDGKLTADITGDSATTNQHTIGHDEDENVVVAWDGGEVITPDVPTGSALPISQGGTGATTAASARTNLGLGSAATYNVVSTVNDDSNLVTGAAIKAYYEAVGVPSAISTTSAATAAKVATCSSFKLLANSYIQVILANANTASSALTLNINSTGAKPIWINGSASSSSNKTLPAGSYFVFYNGTNYYFRTDGKLTADIVGTVNGHDVEADVPSSAVFTDTLPSAQCNTASDVTVKFAYAESYSLRANSYLHVNIKNSNTAASKLTFNVGNTGEKNLYINGSISSSTNYTLPSGTYIAFYDGINWYFRTDGRITSATATSGTSDTTLATTAFVANGLSSKVNNTITSAIPTASSYVTVNSNETHLYKQGRVAVCTFRFSAKSAIPAETDIFTLPDGFQPVSNFRQQQTPWLSTTPTPIQLYANATNVRVGAAVAKDAIFIFTLTWITAS